MLLSDVIIVLSRPSEPGNIGAVCRAMKNMGLSRLRLVMHEMAEMVSAPGATCAAEAIIRTRAVHAADLWEAAEKFDSLAAAVSDCALVVGTTRRRGRHRKRVTMTPRELAAFLKNHEGPAALVFGNERTGLDDEELELCNMASHIPVSDAFPSMNLSHAVQIYAYELFQALSCPEKEAVKGQWVPLDQGSIEHIVRDIAEVFRKLGFYKQAGREEQERFLKSVFSRAGLTEKESRYFADIFTKAAWLNAKNTLVSGQFVEKKE